MIKQRAERIDSAAKRFLEFLSALEPEFRQGFFRFRLEKQMHESCASYKTPDEVLIVSALEHDQFFDDMEDCCVEILSAMGRIPALMLITVDRDVEYEIQFEYADMTRWPLSLANGGSGLPG